MNVSFSFNQMSFYNSSYNQLRLSAYASQAAFSGRPQAVSGGQSQVVFPGQSQVAFPGQSQPNEAGGGQKVNRTGDYDTYECQTCANRKYKDGSNDLGVSFKTPTKLSPEKAASAVRSHEMEHVSRAKAKAAREGSEILSQSVTYRTEVCPECGTPYLAGGNTRTVFRSAPETYDKEPVKKGVYLDLKV